MIIRPSTIHQLAREHLDGEAVHLAPALDPALRDRAIAAVGLGCDHTAGEQIVAVIDDRIHPEVFLGAILTDCRYAWRNMQSSGSIAWEDVARVEVSEGLLVARQHCVLHDGTRCAIPPAGVDLSGFFGALSRIPPRRRSTPPAPLSQPSHRDPTGARTATIAMCHQDDRHAALYELIWRLHERDLAPVARDVTARVTCLHRTVAHGRGSAGGWWLSPLSADDLFHGLSSILGATAGEGERDGLRFIDVEVPAELRREASLCVGALQRGTLGAAGFGRDVTHLRVTARSTPQGAHFVVRGTDAEGSDVLHRLNPTLWRLLHQRLIEVEHRILARRVLGGDAIPIHQLSAQPLEALAAARAVDAAPLRVIGLA